MNIYIVTYDIDYGGRKELNMRAILPANDISEAQKIVETAYEVYDFNKPIPEYPVIKIHSVEDMLYSSGQLFIVSTCPYSIKEIMSKEI